MGVGDLILWDPDTISPVNLGPQGWSPHDLGLHKVDVLHSEIECINPDCRVFATSEKWEKNPSLSPDFLFMCTDSITSRAEIFAAASPRLALFDGRMSAEAVRIFSLPTSDPRRRQRYQETLFPASEQHAEPCTTKATMYCALFAASLLAAQFGKVLRNLTPEFELTGSLLAGELWATP